MKQKIIALALLIFMLCLIAVPAFADVGYQPELWVVDRADLLTQAEEDALSQRLSQISQTYQAQIIIFTTLSTRGKDLDTYIEDVYDDNKLGYGDDHSGILLLVSMDPREFRILTNGSANDAIGSYEIEIISDAIVSDMSDGRYSEAFTLFADRCAYYLDGHRNGFPFDFGTNLMISLVVGIIVGLIVALVLKAQLKSVRQEHRAHAYIKPGSLQITNRFDLFLYRNVTRTKKESSSSSSGARSGSSRSVGGRSF